MCPGKESVRRRKQNSRIEIATAAKLHDQAVEFIGLECGQERVIKLRQDLSLCLSSQELVPASQGSPVHDFHGEIGVGSSELDQVNAPNVSIAEPFQKPEIADPELDSSGGQHIHSVPPYVTTRVWLGRIRGSALNAGSLREYLPRRSQAFFRASITLPARKHGESCRSEKPVSMKTKEVELEKIATFTFHVYSLGKP
ncbi:unnamed protein product [Thlaspi arvense]|uniref:Uncharacterized protein n=1 Tax=Thlaspi arvense TaxID=13288 RepID=A0AAU9SPT2_THLAR|nr:unnamed protein product [Thlaspi arvense]